MAKTGKIQSLWRVSKDTSSYSKAPTREMSEKIPDKNSPSDAALVHSPAAVLHATTQSDRGGGSLGFDHQSQSITLGNQTRKLKYEQRQGPWRTPPSAWLPAARARTHNPGPPAQGRHRPASRGLPHQSRIEETASTERPTSRSDGFNSSTDARSNKNWLSQAEAN